MEDNMKIKKVVSMFMIFAIILSQQPLGSFAAEDHCTEG